MHRMRRLRRHLPDGLHHLHAKRRGRGFAGAAEGALAASGPGPLCRRRPEDRPGDGKEAHRGARGGVDMRGAMNPQTWDNDLASIEPGGYLFYDPTKPMPSSKFRADISVIGVPLTAITNSTYTDPRQRQLFKNIIYLGALCALLDMDPKLIEQLIREQYKGQEKLLSSNVHALHLWRDWALQNLKCPIGLRVKKADKVGDRIFMAGNSAAALGAVY